MGYSNAIFHMDYVNGNNAARTALTSVAFANNGSGGVRATKISHGIVTGAIAAVTLSTNYNGNWKITKITDDTFDLDTATYVSDRTGTVTPYGGQNWADAWKTPAAVGAILLSGDIVKMAKSPDPTSLGITASWNGIGDKLGGGLPAAKSIVSSTNATPIVVSCTTHGFNNGDVVWITGHLVNLAANGMWVVANKTVSTFELEGSIGSGVGVATGTVQLSNARCVKLASPLTKILHSFDSGKLTAWSPGISCTNTLTTADWKEGRNAYQIVTGTLASGQELAYTDLGSQVDYSGYEQLSFWFKNSTTAMALGDIQIKFYSDAARTVEVDSLNLPAIACTTRWVPIVIDKGSPLSNVVRCISIVSTIAMSAKTFLFDNLIACKDSSSGDSLTLQSLISKNSSAQGGAEGWYAIQSITDKIIVFENSNGIASDVQRGYSGVTDLTAATYKRETIKTSLAIAAATVALQPLYSGTLGNNIQYQGGYDTSTSVQNGETFFDGLNGWGYGWMVMTNNYITHNWLSLVRYSRGVYFQGNTGLIVTNLSNVNHNSEYGIFIGSTTSVSITNLLNVNNNAQGITFDGSCVLTTIDYVGSISNNYAGVGIVYYQNSACKRNSILAIDKVDNNASYGINFTGNNNYLGMIGSVSYNVNNGLLMTTGASLHVASIGKASYNSAAGVVVTAVFDWMIGEITQVNSNTGQGVSILAYSGRGYIGNVSANNNSTYGITITSAGSLVIMKGSTSGNTTGGVSSGNFETVINNFSMAEATKLVFTPTAGYDSYVRLNKYNNIVDDHRSYAEFGSIVSDSVIRHTASGISWKFAATNVARDQFYPLQMTIAKVACVANKLVTVKVWAKKSHATEVVGKLLCRAYQLTGITEDKVATTDIADTAWNELTITFTPTEAGVVGIDFLYWIAGTSTTDFINIDDMTITQVT